MKKLIFIIPLAIVLILVGVYFVSNSNDSNNNQQTNNSATPSPNNQSAPSTNKLQITAESLATNNSANSCWTVISGKVYDLTEYIPRHPGEDDVLLACGKDGTTLFTARKTDSGQTIGSGTPHDKSATNQLGKYYIGDFISE